MSKNDLPKLHFIIMIWSFTAIIGKWIDLSSTALVLYRALFTVVGLVIFMFIIGKTLKSSRPWAIMAVGAMLGFHWILFFAAAKVSTVSICLIGLSTQSLFAAFLEPLFIKLRKISILEIALGLVCSIAIALIFHFENGYITGLLMSIFSAIIAALFSVFNGIFAKEHHYTEVLLYEMLGAAAFCLLAFPLVGTLWPSEIQNISPSLTEWGLIAVLAWFCTIFPYSIMLDLMKRISVFLFNLTLNLEPVYGIVLAFLIFGEKEHMTQQFYFSGLLILAAVAIYPIIKKRQSL